MRRYWILGGAPSLQYSRGTEGSLARPVESKEEIRRGWPNSTYRCVPTSNTLPNRHCHAHCHELHRFHYGTQRRPRLCHAMVRGTRQHHHRPSLHPSSDRHVSARQLVTHYREYDFLVGLWTRNRRFDEPRKVHRLLFDRRDHFDACTSRSQSTLNASYARRERRDCRRYGRVHRYLPEG